MAKKLIKKEVGPVRHNHIYQIEPEKSWGFIRDCLSLNHTHSIETLEVEKSFAREYRKDLSIQDVLDKIEESTNKYFSFLLRKGVPFFRNSDYFEFCAVGENKTIDYFLWIEIEEESGCRLVEKYNLKKNDEL